MSRVNSLTVEGFRSIRNLEVKFETVNLVTGANGAGKSNLFNAFRLLKAAIEGRLAASIIEEGGLESILWAGPKDKGPVRLKLAVEVEPFHLTLEVGLRPQSEFPLFELDPQIKLEEVRLAGRVMVSRKTSVADMRTLDGPKEMRLDLVDSESIFAQIGDPEKYSYLYLLKEMVARWTFYHEFRTDAQSPIRRPAVGTFTARLAEDGANLGPAWYVIQNRGEIGLLQEIVSSALPELKVRASQTSIIIEQLGVLRQLNAAELSDGTLKFLCLAAACFSVHPAPLIAFNEPETSLNPQAVSALARLFTHCAERSQLWITTHSEELARDIGRATDCRRINLVKVDGETTKDGRSSRLGYREEE